MPNAEQAAKIGIKTLPEDQRRYHEDPWPVFNDPSIYEIVSKKVPSASIIAQGWQDERILFLSSLFHNPWKVLLAIGLCDKAMADSLAYECPYIEGNRHYRIVPIAIVSESKQAMEKVLAGASKYVRSRISFALDPMTVRSFIESYKFSIDVHSSNIIIRTMLGHGYDPGALPSDGHGQVVPMRLELTDDSSYIVCLGWEWIAK